MFQLLVGFIIGSILVMFVLVGYKMFLDMKSAKIKQQLQQVADKYSVNENQLNSLKDDGLQIQTYTEKYPLINCDLNSNLSFYQQLVQQAVLMNITNTRKLKDPLTHQLSGGKRLRPVLVLEIARFYKPIVNPIALAIDIEYLHQSSLILDDMADQDSIRRNKETLHVKYGQSEAQLCALMLLSINTLNLYSLIYDLSKKTDLLTTAVIQNQLQTLLSQQMQLAIEGQYSDIQGQQLDSLNEHEKQEYLLDLFYKKTATFFELACYWGIVVSEQGVNKQSVANMKSLGRNIGICYQIFDDLDDMETDLAKNKGNINIACQLGKSKAETILNDHIKKIVSILRTEKMSDLQFWKDYLGLAFGSYGKDVLNQQEYSQIQLC